MVWSYTFLTFASEAEWLGLKSLLIVEDDEGCEHCQPGFEVEVVGQKKSFIERAYEGDADGGVPVVVDVESEPMFLVNVAHSVDLPVEFKSYQVVPETPKVVFA